MKFQVGHPIYLLFLPIALGWVYWLTWKTDVQVSERRRWTAFALRCLSVIALILALAELQCLWPQQGMNVFYLLDRSDSISPAQQEFAKDYVNRSAYAKERNDKGGVITFGSDAAIENTLSPALTFQKVESVVDGQRTDVSGALRLAGAAFPEAGQKRIVLLSDGNENIGDATMAAAQAKSAGVSIDVVPLSVQYNNDVAIQKVALPSSLKTGQTFEAKVFINADQSQSATVSLYRNDQFLGRQKVQLSAGKNLFTFPQLLSEPGFYGYDVRVDADGDTVPQNNRAMAFTTVRGEPRILVISSDIQGDKPLVEALRTSGLKIQAVGINAFPNTLAEIQSYDAIFLSNIAAGDLGTDSLKLLESAVRDFGVGLVCIGGDQTYTAGAYRGTPLEDMLPVSMELDSKKILPSGALALVMDKSGSMVGSKIQAVKDAANGAVAALGNNDYIGVLAFDDAVYNVADMQKAVNKKDIMEHITGIQAGGGTAMYPPMVRAHEMLKSVPANLKHCIILTDGDSLPDDFYGVTRAMAADKITVSTVGVGSDVNGQLLQDIAAIGKGRYYHVTSPDMIPQIFIKETAVILKSSIDENPFKPQLRSSTEVVRGISANEYPALQGYVVTAAKSRAETPLWTDKGDPLLAHWEYGLGRAVAFTSDARAKWAKEWMNWSKYKEFWTQIAQWSLRRLENSDFATEVVTDGAKGQIGVDALDERGDYRNFLDLKAIAISPKGVKTTVALHQTGPGHYEADFPIREVGLYTLNLLDEKDGRVRGSQVVGASVNYSPEYSAFQPNMNLLRQITEITGGRVLNPENPTDDNPFQHDRQPTYRTLDLWEWLLRFAIILFPFDVAVRRIQLDAEEVSRAWQKLQKWLFPWRSFVPVTQSTESLAVLLAHREQIRSSQPQIVLTNRNARDDNVSDSRPQSEMKSATSEPTAKDSSPEPPGKLTTVTERLLEAKRRSQERGK